MIILGDLRIACEKITPICAVEDIAHTQNNTTLLYHFDFALLTYTQKNLLHSCVVVNTLQELLYASKFGVRYIAVEKSLGKRAQQIADNYMFDSQILVIIEDETELLPTALAEIDGVIYKKVVENGF